jgi:hypothetical protein
VNVHWVIVGVRVEGNVSLCEPRVDRLKLLPKATGGLCVLVVDARTLIPMSALGPMMISCPSPSSRSSKVTLFSLIS